MLGTVRGVEARGAEGGVDAEAMQRMSAPERAPPPRCKSDRPQAANLKLDTPTYLSGGRKGCFASFLMTASLLYDSRVCVLVSIRLCMGPSARRSPSTGQVPPNPLPRGWAFRMHSDVWCVDV